MKCGALIDNLPYRKFLTVCLLVGTKSVEGRVRVKTQYLPLFLYTEGKGGLVAPNKESEIKTSKITQCYINNSFDFCKTISVFTGQAPEIKTSKEFI